MDLIFMGTPRFAEISLLKLISSGCNIKAVFCNKDKPVGRKKEIKMPPVKVAALNSSIDVYQPDSLKDKDVLDKIKEINPDLIVVVAYGKFLPKQILEIPKKGVINLHGSLLPKYRGAAPIQRSVINGEKLTGLSTMYLIDKMDAGDIIDQVEVEILDSDTSKELFKKMAIIGAELLLNTINDIEKGIIKRCPQNESEASYAPPLTKEEALIDFSDDAKVVHNKIRGYYDWPKGHINYKGKKLVLIESRVVDELDGEVLEILSSKDLIIGCGSSSCELLKVQLEGKGVVSGREFINGQRLKLKDKLI